MSEDSGAKLISGATDCPVDAAGWLSGATQIASPNFDERAEGTEISLLVVHAISLPPGEFGTDFVQDLFTNCLDPTVHPYFEAIYQVRVSAHFYIRRGGELIQFVPCGARAWHAGISIWKGRERCNDFSIGIELEGCDEKPFTDAQYDALNTLIAGLAKRYPLKDITGHSDIAPGRKTDPGPYFEWHRVQHQLLATD